MKCLFEKLSIKNIYLWYLNMTKKNTIFYYSLYYMKCFTGTVVKTHLLLMSKNDVQLLTNVSHWTPVKFAKQFLILLIGTWNIFIDRPWDRNRIRTRRFRNKRFLRDSKVECGILLLQSNKWIVFELKEANYLVLICPLNIILYYNMTS